MPPCDTRPFSGSYTSDDCIFLLKPISLAPTPLAEKERLIQSGTRHYSEMIGSEQLPSPAYLSTFHGAMQRNRKRVAVDLFRLACAMNTGFEGPLTIVSLARAGTPIGILLHRILRDVFQRKSTHYSISIIRDRGIDTVALQHILEKGHQERSLIFVDGWTGKGVISEELQRSVAAFNDEFGTRISAGLWVLADLCGHAEMASTSDDYLIPSCVLNSTISGLISRTILNREILAANDFHGCVFYDEWKTHDLSEWFLGEMIREVSILTSSPAEKAQAMEPVKLPDPRQLRQRSEAYLEKVLQSEKRILHRNFIKPGIGESTRVLLRRVPDALILQQPSHPETEHLRLLAQEKKVPVVLDSSLPYQAVSLIRNARA